MAWASEIRHSSHRGLQLKTLSSRKRTTLIPLPLTSGVVTTKVSVHVPEVFIIPGGGGGPGPLPGKFAGSARGGGGGGNRYRYLYN